MENSCIILYIFHTLEWRLNLFDGHQLQETCGYRNWVKISHQTCPALWINKLSTRCFCRRLFFCAVPLVFMSHRSCHCQGRCVYLSLLELSGFHKREHIGVSTIVGRTHKHANADVLRQWCVCCVLHEGSSWQKQDKELLTMPSSAVLSEHDSGGSSHLEQISNKTHVALLLSPRLQYRRLTAPILYIKVCLQAFVSTKVCVKKFSSGSCEDW